MNRIQVACWCLIASAFVLTGLLCVRLDGRLAQKADAGVVLTRDSFTLLTAKTKDNEEALFVLENSSGKLLIYTLNLTNRRLELSRTALVGDLFNDAGVGAPAAGAAPGGRTRTPR